MPLFIPLLNCIGCVYYNRVFSIVGIQQFQIRVFHKVLPFLYRGVFKKHLQRGEQPDGLVENPWRPLEDFPEDDCEM